MPPLPPPWTVALDTATDAECDAFLSPAARQVARVFWTPAAVARRAAEIFCELGVTRVLDLGSGPGKFCLLAAARAPGIAFVGVEHRPHLIATARAFARATGLTNVHFDCGDACSIPAGGYDAFYVYNSFAENAFERVDQFDQTVELSAVRRIDDLMRVHSWLGTREPGTVLLTYHGLGGPIPSSYECVSAERAGSDWLRAWRQTTQRASGAYWLEDQRHIHVATLAEVVAALTPHIHRRSRAPRLPSIGPRRSGR